jgi:hypothetical protein
MLRYSLFVAAVLGSAATAIAAIAPVADDMNTSSKNLTVIEKNQAFPIYGPIIVEQCATEDCSEVNS